MLRFTLNGKTVETDLAPDTPLLWAVRDGFKLKGSKFGCGAWLCGACTMHVDGVAQKTCVLPLAAVAGKTVTTIEGVTATGAAEALQAAWVAQSVSQCGYCQSGQIMAASALLAQNPNPTEADVEAAMAGNICRCGCYPRIKSAVLAAAATLAPDAVVQGTPFKDAMAREASA